MVLIHINSDTPLVAPIPDAVETRIHDELFWLHLNQQFRPIPAQMLYPVHAAIDHFLRSNFYEPGHNMDHLLPVNVLLRYGTSDVTLAPRQPVEVTLRTHIRTLRRSDGLLDRAYMYHSAEVWTADEAAHKVAFAEGWQQLVRLFDRPERRRPETLPPALAALPEVALAADAALLETYEAFQPAVVGDAPGSGTYRESFVFHLDRTDLLQHTNTVAYLHVAEDVLAKGVLANGGPAGRLRPRQLLVRFRKPFLLGEVGTLHVHTHVAAQAFSGTVWFQHDAAAAPAAKPSVVVRIDGDVFD